MEIFYSNKQIFWSNNSNDYLEKSVYDTYLNDWIQIDNNKSINWDSHYRANFYASDSFSATYFKVVKDNFNYYFFVADISFDSNKGKQFFLELDFYYTYTVNFIETLKTNNPLIYFKRKHANRFNLKNNVEWVDVKTQHQYLLNIPDELMDLKNNVISTNYYRAVPTVYRYIAFKDVLTGNAVEFKPAYPPDTENILYYEKTSRYFYLKIIKPRLEPAFQIPGGELHNANTVYYVPIFWGAKSGPNSIVDVNKIPADYVIGLVSSPIAPPEFVYGGKISQLYANETSNSSVWAGIESYVLTPLINTQVEINYMEIGSYTVHRYFDGINFKTPYNIDNFNSEIALHLEPFSYYTIGNLGKYSLNYLLNNITDIANDDSLRTVITYNISTDIFLYLPHSGLLANQPSSTFFVKTDEDLPYNSNVYTSYLNNNINSINTGIALAKEQRDIISTNNTDTGGSKAFWGFASAAVGGVLLNATGGVFGGGLVLKGGSDITGAFGERYATVRQANFDLKSKIETTKANIADARNRPDKMLDTYGAGIGSLNQFSGIITKWELPDNLKKVVFSSYYFNGYVTNTFYNFNEYNNRISFNYFEIGDAYQFAQAYLKYPKRILQSIAKQCEKGLRLWKTISFDYTGKLDNREVNL